MPECALEKPGFVHCLQSALVLLTIALALSCGPRSHKVTDQKQSTATAAALPKPNPEPESDASLERDADKSYTVVEARHVIFDEKSGVRLRALWLQGRLYPTHKGVIPSLDDPASFKVEVEEGKTQMSVADLSTVLRNTIFKNSKLSGVHLNPRGRNELEITGTLHEVVPLPVRLTGEIAATEDGRISVHIDRVRVLKIPFKGVLDLIHLKPASLVSAAHASGMEVKGDSLYLRTDELLPAPRKTGHVTAVYFTSDGQLEEDYGYHASEKPAVGNWNRARWRNYIRLSGGRLRFGKLTMDSADLTLLDTSPGDWFSFDLARYHQQLVAGDMRMTPGGGLQVFVPDITKLHLRQDVPQPPGTAP